MKNAILAIFALLTAPQLFSQIVKNKPEVEKLCGCFEVQFKYAETFSPDPGYKFHERDEISGGTEFTFPVEVSNNKIVMQHLLVISDSMIIKHWREDWTYENPELWKYTGDKIWVKEQLKPAQIKGKWTQSVWEVSDAPRYQGISEWVSTNGKTFWENTTDAPLPRREYSVRNDYNILRRTNRLVLNDSGYIHEQDNQKIIRKDRTDKLLAEEKGINSYHRVNDKQCAAARIYWEKNKEYWTRVRIAWGQYVGIHSTITLKDKIDGKVLHDHLFDLADEYAEGKIKTAALDEKIKMYITTYTTEATGTVSGR